MKIITEKQNDIRRNTLMNLLAEHNFLSIEQFQSNNGLVVDGICGEQTYSALYYHILNVTDLSAFKGNYFSDLHEKKQIVWHHSAGWDNGKGMYDWWMNDGVYHVATSVGIVDDGRVFRGFSEDMWAYHIGMHHVNNWKLNKESIAVEICNWGALTYKDGKYYSWAGIEVPEHKTIQVDYKGYGRYEAYTIYEVHALKYWTLLVSMKHGISLEYSDDDMWDVSEKAIQGSPGLYTHNSYLPWKTDVCPQPMLVEMANELIHYQTT